MAEADCWDGRRFTVSTAEGRRREAAFHRLGVATALSAALATSDLALNPV